MDLTELIQAIESGDRESFTVSDDRPADVCRVCGGSGWEYITVDKSDVYGPGSMEPAAIECTACKGGFASKVRREKKKSAISKDASLSDFDWGVYTGYDLKREERLVSQFVDHYQDFESVEHMGLFISSKTRGSGKTFLANAIANELINRYAVSTKFVNASDLLEISKQKREDGSDSLAELIGVRLLITDDIGQKRTGTDWLSDVLYRIIDKRYTAKRLVIVTSNVELQELDLDDRIVDRLYSMTLPIRLPEFCVRARDANARKQAILAKYGL